MSIKKVKCPWCKNDVKFDPDTSFCVCESCKRIVIDEKINNMIFLNSLEKEYFPELDDFFDLKWHDKENRLEITDNNYLFVDILHRLEYINKCFWKPNTPKQKISQSDIDIIIECLDSIILKDEYPNFINSNNLNYSVKFKVLKGIKKGKPIYDDEYLYIPKDYLCGHKQKEYFALKINNKELEPYYFNGDIVLVKKQPVPDCSGQNGVFIKDGKFLISKIEYPVNRGQIKLVFKKSGHNHESIFDNIADTGYVGVPVTLKRNLNQQ